LLPWAALVAFGAPSAFMPPAAGAPARSMAERLTFRTMLFALALAAVGIAAWGATNVAARYMHPILVIAPVYVFARIARLAPGEERIRQYATFAVAVAIVILTVRFAAAVDNPLTQWTERRFLLPYAGLADALKERGIEDGTVVGPDVREAGNIRAFLPNLRVVAGDSLRVERVPRRASDERSCVLVWTELHDAGARRMAPFDPAAAEKIEVRKEPGGLIATRAATWSMVRLDPNAQVCR
jgi:hypothetical protein